jgi:hypothetical protein
MMEWSFISVQTVCLHADSFRPSGVEMITSDTTVRSTNKQMLSLKQAWLLSHQSRWSNSADYMKYSNVINL